MARERQVECPRCHHKRTTRANPRVLLRCDSCGEGFRAPPIADGWQGPGRRRRREAPAAAHEAADAAADLAAEILPAPLSTAVKVTRAAHTTVRAGQAADKAEKRTGGRRPSSKPAEELTPAQRAGQRGGRAREPRRPAFLRRVGR